MKTSVYLSNRSIAAVTGDKSGPRSCFCQDIPWGLVHNGAVADPVGLKAALAAFWQANGLPRKNVSLVIDSDSVVGRILDVPPLAPNMIRDLVRRELAAGQPQGSLVCDYSVISPSAESGGGQVYAVAAERAMVDAFVEAFASAGVRLGGLDVSISCAMRFFGAMPAMKERTFIFSLLDGPDIISMLFADNGFSFLDRGQLTEERGTPAAAVEISRALSSMVQYSYARRGKSPLSHAYISGLVGEEAQFYGDIAQALNHDESLSISVEALPPPAAAVPGQADYGRYLFCLGDILG